MSVQDWQIQSPITKLNELISGLKESGSRWDTDVNLEMEKLIDDLEAGIDRINIAGRRHQIALHRDRIREHEDQIKYLLNKGEKDR